MLSDNDALCKGIGHRVLLAQMPLAKARHLVDQIEDSQKKSSNILPVFEVVITQIDQKEYTDNVSLKTCLPEEHENSSQATRSDCGKRRTFFVVPAPNFNPNVEDPAVRIQRVDIRAKEGSMENRIRQTPLTPYSEAFIDPALTSFKEGVEKKFKGKSTNTTYQSARLMAMMKYCHADAAMLQPRDIYQDFDRSVRFWPTFGQSDSINHALRRKENFMEEILWKGDLVTCQAITGADLRKALAQSESIAKQNNGGPAQSDLSLARLGIEPDRLHDTYIIAGEALDDKRLYPIAMTDFLALGDTGYPDLKAADLGELESLADFENKETLLPLCRNLLRMAQQPASADPITPTSPAIWRCPKCQGPMLLIERFTARQIQTVSAKTGSLIDSS